MKKIQKKKKSKTTQLNKNDIIAINSTQLFRDDDYPFSLSTDKFRLEKEKQFYPSKYNRLNDTFKKFKKKNDLTIDTRRIPLNLIESSKKQKFNFLDYRHKKYRNHKFPFNTKIKTESYDINNNIITNKEPNNDRFIIDNLTLEQKIKNMKYQFIKSPINGCLPNFALTYSHLPHKAVGNSLYTMLTIRKNQFEDGYNHFGENENSKFPKINQIQFILSNNNSSIMSSYFGRKDEYRKYVDLLSQPFSYISLLNEDYSISEKMRFQKMMDKLNKVKKCIEEKPDEEFEIAKEFILSIGLYDLTNLDIEKLNNFLNFIKTDFLIDPSKNLKENIFNILNRNSISKPSISNALDCINEEFLLNELRKKRDLLKHKKIGELFNCFNEKYIEMNNNLNNNKSNSDLSEKIFNKTLNQFKHNKYLKKNKKTKTNNLINNIIKPKPLEHKGLCIDLKRQQEINLSTKTKELDIVNSPKIVMDMIKKEIIKNNYKDKTRAKTHYNWCRNVNRNKRLYGAKRQENAEYNEIKKKNMLTEYICLMKAKNNMKISNLKEKYKL